MDFIKCHLSNSNDTVYISIEQILFVRQNCEFHTGHPDGTAFSLNGGCLLSVNENIEEIMDKIRTVQCDIEINKIIKEEK
ncbi:MAG: hypothetical protein HWN81_00330 [Candidatus Lokiarchaeota archaeon]|nr:hypothetical protein [Candidatus Lokiarchaeota archaeon]